VNEAQFSKFVHEETHTRPGRADHFRKRLLADFRDYRRRSAFLAEVRQQQKQMGTTFLARIKQLIVLKEVADRIGEAPVKYNENGEAFAHPEMSRELEKPGK
jgi:hypothetical protein